MGFGGGGSSTPEKKRPEVTVLDEKPKQPQVRTALPLAEYKPTGSDALLAPTGNQKRSMVG